MAYRSLHPALSKSIAFAFAALLGALIWAHWTSLTEVAERWANDPQYSHGWLVPGFAVALLWLRRAQLPAFPLRGSAWGCAILGFGVTLRLAGTFFHYVWVEQISFVPCVGGVFVLLGGLQAVRWAWPAVLFLVFMIPMPYRLGVALASPLRTVATTASTYLLQAFGLPALAEGNVIRLNELSLDVVEACSGLRMLMVFFALASAVALVTERPLWERFLLLASALPIALVANIARITVTGVLLTAAGTGVARAVYHDLAGWLMMPLGLALLGLECWFLGRLWIEEPATIYGQRGGDLSRTMNGSPVPATKRTPWREIAPAASK